MSESIVMELQREAMDSSSDISDLLRKSLVVARKLKIEEFEKWIQLEMNGYFETEEEIPQYREVNGNVQWFNDVRGWCPLIINDEKTLDLMSKHKTSQSISEIEMLANHEGDYLILQLPQGLQNALSQSTGQNTLFRLKFGKQQVKKTLDRVRNIILDWTLKLEEEGIIGEGLTFSKEEKEEAQKQNWTMNFHGNVNGFQMQNHSNNSSQTMEIGMNLGKVEEFVSTLNSHLSEVGLPLESKQLVQSEIDMITSELGSTKPKQKIIKQSLSTIRNVLEGTTGSIVASGLLHHIQLLMGG